MYNIFGQQITPGFFLQEENTPGFVIKINIPTNWFCYDETGHWFVQFLYVSGINLVINWTGQNPKPQNEPVSAPGGYVTWLQIHQWRIVRGEIDRFVGIDGKELTWIEKNMKEKNNLR